MPVHDDLGNRMKGYEAVSKTTLVRRMPVILRIDGKAFHSFTRGFEKPFDDVMVASMQHTMLELCKQIQGAVLGYTQSDEITIVLVDYKKLNSQAWFDNEVQKMCSVAASIATAEFNKAFRGLVLALPSNVSTSLLEAYTTKSGKAMFDCRAFNIPKEEVTNCLYWRQLDAVRNSIEMVGHAYFSHGELYKKSCLEIKRMLWEKHRINWDELPLTLQRGSCAVKQISEVSERGTWVIDNKIPMFIGADRDYIDRLIFVGEDE